MQCELDRQSAFDPALSGWKLAFIALENATLSSLILITV
jgi:hypothetical protein